MRVVLVLCLLAFMSCQKDIIDIAKCLYENPKIKELISDVMIAIATKDFSKLWPKIMESLPELIQAVVKCVMTENEVNLQMKDPIRCPLCKVSCNVKNYEIRQACLKRCNTLYC